MVRERDLMKRALGVVPGTPRNNNWFICVMAMSVLHSGCLVVG